LCAGEVQNSSERRLWRGKGVTYLAIRTEMTFKKGYTERLTAKLGKTEEV